MRINLSKKNKIIAIALVVLVLGATGGYLLWRVNQDDTVAPTDSDASGCRTVCNSPRVSCGDVLPGNNCEEGCAGYMDGSTFGCCEYHLEGCEPDPICGDNSCNGSETLASCPADCAECGDNVCTSPTETLATCPGDCAVCGDNICTSPTETLATCPGDCGTCGDGTCSGEENATSCAADCKCKAFEWYDKPVASYKPADEIANVLVINPNSSSGTKKDVAIKLNDVAMPLCEEATTTTGNCYLVKTNQNDKQALTIKLFREETVLTEGTYALSVTVPGENIRCSESTSFVVSESAVVPDTGLFDGVMGKIYAGAGLVFLGLVTTQFPKVTYMFNTFAEKNGVVLEERRRKREEEKRNRFERRFK